MLVLFLLLAMHVSTTLNMLAVRTMFNSLHPTHSSLSFLLTLLLTLLLIPGQLAEIVLRELVAVCLRITALRKSLSLDLLRSLLECHVLELLRILSTPCHYSYQ